jgi:hypothetical protein
MTDYQLVAAAYREEALQLEELRLRQDSLKEMRRRVIELTHLIASALELGLPSESRPRLFADFVDHAKLASGKSGTSCSSCCRLIAHGRQATSEERQVHRLACREWKPQS